MSTKSDFAQKLLNDLRMRKERMAAASQSSSAHSTQLTVSTSDAYGNQKQANQGSRQIKALESAGLKPTKQHKRSNMIIVPFKGGQQNQNYPKLGDLSMVLSFALENGIKLIGSNGNNNNQAHLHSASHQHPTLSTTHISDISKGAHKLNEILRAYSNGVNLDRHSVEIGSQLLKGAMDLEESLRMLVNLQEASENMSTPKRKNQIRLLDDEEEDDEVDNNELADKQKQLVLPRFSFDKPRKNDQEKGRISSVIAKLMGLDDMSNNVTTNNVRKASSSEQKVTPEGLKNSDSGSRNNHGITHVATGKSVIQNSQVNPNTQNGFQEKRKLKRETVVKSEEKKVQKERTGSSSSRNRSTLHSKQKDLQKENETEPRNSSRSKDEIVDPEKKHPLHSVKEKVDEHPQKSQTSSRKSEEVVTAKPNAQKGKASSGSVKEKSLNVIPIESKSGNLPHFATPLRHQVPISNDAKAKRYEKKINSKRADKGSALKQRGAKTELHKEAAVAECENMILDAPEEHSTNLTNNQADPTSDQQRTPQKMKEQEGSLNNGNSEEEEEERTTVSPPSNQERREIPTSRKPLVLTEDEARLKLILIRSQLFLHTAVALFKLDFPVGILHISGEYGNSHGKDDKVIIECGYEIMRRKGKRQEESIHHPCLKRIESLDELVRRLNEELGNLKSYGRNRRSEGDSGSSSLFNMVERDIAVNKYPDINCMWDSGWNDAAMFAAAEREETIRDVEKQVLNGLLDELTMDLLSPFKFHSLLLHLHL